MSNQLSRNIPVLRLLFGTSMDSRFTFLRIALWFGCLYVLGVLVTVLDGTASLTRGGIGYLQDPANVVMFLSFIFSFHFLASLQKRFLLAFASNPDSPGQEPDIFNVVRNDAEFRSSLSKVVTDKINVVALGTRTARVIFWWMVVAVFMLFCLTSVLLPLQSFQGKHLWPFLWNSSYGDQIPRSHYLASYVFNQFKDCIFWVVIMPIMLWQVITIAWGSNRIVQHVRKHDAFTINPLAPDGAGGLKPLGDLSLLLFYILFAQFVLVVVMGFFLGYPISHRLIYPLLLLLSAYVFFAPLRSAHQSLRVAKTIEMRRLSQLFTQKYEEHKKTSKKDATGAESGTDILELTALKELYREAEKLPVWPYDLGTISKFSSLFFIPFAIAMIQALLSLGVSDLWKNLMSLFGVFADK